MSTRLLLLSIIIVAPQAYAMKRSSQKLLSATRIFECQNNELFIPDIEHIITSYASRYPLSKKPKEASNLINLLAQTNKNFNFIINQPIFSDNLIKMLGHTLYCSHETIARLLSTKQAKYRLHLQYELKNLCRYSYLFGANPQINKLNSQELERLITKKVDLEFTYNDIPSKNPHLKKNYSQQKTALMLSSSYSNSMFDLLLNKVNINMCNSHGITPLKFLIQQPINLTRFRQTLKHPDLDINKQNNHGESALLRCLMRTTNIPITDDFIVVITELLDAGADPELANKRKITPLIRAHQLSNERIINLINLAIKKKHSLS